MDQYKINTSITFKREGKNIAIYVDDHHQESFELYEDILDYLKEKLDPNSFIVNLRTMEKEEFFKGITRCSLNRNEILEVIKIIEEIEDGQENYLENYNVAEIDLLENFFEHIYKFHVDESSWEWIKIEHEEGYDEQESERFQKKFGEKNISYLNRVF